MFKNKRILAFLLALVMVFGTVLPVTSFANEDIQEEFETEKVKEIFFRIYDKDNVEQTKRGEYKLQYKATENADYEDHVVKHNTDPYVSAYYAELTVPGVIANAQRLHSIKNDDGFEDGFYRVFLTNYEFYNEEDEVVKFTVSGGKVVPQGEDEDLVDGSAETPFTYTVKTYEAENNLDVYVKGSNKSNQLIRIYTIAKNDAEMWKTETNKYRFKNGRPVPGHFLAEFRSDNHGYAGLQYTTNADGEIVISSQDPANQSGGNIVIPKGEMLVITLGDDQSSALLLNLWRVKDEYKAQYDRVDDYKAVLNEPIQNIEALAQQSVNFIIPEPNTDITLRVRIETAGNRADRLPVTNSLVRISKPSTIEHGKVVEVGEMVEEKRTNEAGYVEFTLPEEEAVKMFQYDMDDRYATYEGELGLTNQTVPYLIQQVDNGGFEGLAIDETLYTLADAQYNSAANLFELYIYNETDLAYRIAGPDRYATAVAIAEENYPTGLQSFDGKTRIVIASGESYPDALTATTTAYYYNAPLVLVTKNDIPEATLEYVRTQAPDEIVVLGGEAAVSEQVCLDLQEAAGADYLNRIYGKDRYGTSVANADNLLKLKNDSTGNTLVKGFFGNEAKILVASGENFPDALAAAAPAADKGYPLLLVGKDYYPPIVKEWIEDNFVKNAYIIGGEAAISERVQLAIGNTGSVAVTDRDYGRDRAETSVIVGQASFPNANHVYVTSGAVFADALTGSTLAAKNGYPVILLPNADTVSEEIAEYLRSSNVTGFTVLGGDATVSPAARQEISNILLGK